MTRTALYVDGQNLFNRCLKGTAFKWLNPIALVPQFEPGLQVERFVYTTAPLPRDGGTSRPRFHHLFLTTLDTRVALAFCTLP